MRAVSSSWIGNCASSSLNHGCQEDPSDPSGLYLCRKYPSGDCTRRRIRRSGASRRCILLYRVPGDECAVARPDIRIGIAVEFHDIRICRGDDAALVIDMEPDREEASLEEFRDAGESPLKSYEDLFTQLFQ